MRRWVLVAAGGCGRERERQGKKTRAKLCMKRDVCMRVKEGARETMLWKDGNNVKTNKRSNSVETFAYFLGSSRGPFYFTKRGGHRALGSLLDQRAKGRAGL